MSVIGAAASRKAARAARTHAAAAAEVRKSTVIPKNKNKRLRHQVGPSLFIEPLSLRDAAKKKSLTRVKLELGLNDFATVVSTEIIRPTLYPVEM